MEALILEEVRKLNPPDIAIPETLGNNDVRIKLHTVGIGGSDVHYYALQWYKNRSIWFRSASKPSTRALPSL